MKKRTLASSLVISIAVAAISWPAFPRRNVEYCFPADYETFPLAGRYVGETYNAYIYNANSLVKVGMADVLDGEKLHLCLYRGFVPRVDSYRQGYLLECSISTLWKIQPQKDKDAVIAYAIAAKDEFAMQLGALAESQYFKDEYRGRIQQVLGDILERKMKEPEFRVQLSATLDVVFENVQTNMEPILSTLVGDIISETVLNFGDELFSMRAGNESQAFSKAVVENLRKPEVQEKMIQALRDTAESPAMAENLKVIVSELSRVFANDQRLWNVIQEMGNDPKLEPYFRAVQEQLVFSLKKICGLLFTTDNESRLDSFAGLYAKAVLLNDKQYFVLLMTDQQFAVLKQLGFSTISIKGGI